MTGGAFMAEKSIIIIGAGLAGLSAGCYGQMNGYRTRIFEHHYEPGGVAIAWKRDGYLIDGGIHYLMGHRPGQACYELYRELGILKNRHYPDLTTFMNYIDEIGDCRIQFSSDLDQLRADLKKLAPADAGLIDELIAGVRAMQATDVFGLMATAPELMGLLGPLKQMWGLRRVLRYFGGPYNLPVEQFAQRAKDEKLRRWLINLFLPEVPVWFVLLLLALLANKQMGLLAGSCTDFVSSLAERYQGLGGEVTYRATVQEILVENNRAVGVRLADGSEHRADLVISAGDGYSTIFKMLGGRYVDRKITARFEKWPLFLPIMTISYGVAREYPDVPPLNFLFVKKPVTVGGVTLDGFPVRVFNYSPVFAPAGKTVVQALVHTDWKFWNDLQHDRARYEIEKQRVAADILNRLEPHYPGITAAVELTDVATPYTTWRYTLNHEGAFMGWRPTPTAMRTQLPKTLPGLDNFYMAGQWVAPGGGVPPVLYSGRQVIQLVCHADGKRFVVSRP